MATKNSKVKPTVKANPRKATPVKNVQTFDLLDGVEHFLSKYQRWLFAICILLAVLFSVLTFDLKISDGYDDADYIQAGYSYAKNFFGYYYTSKPPLYTMVLAIPIALFGLNLAVLKALSAVFFVVGLWLLYITFRKRVANYILLPAMLITAVNASMLYYASQTYTEMFMFMIIALFMYAFFWLDDFSDEHPVKKAWKPLLILGFVLFLYYMSRSLAYAALVAAVGYWVYRKKYLLSGATVFSFAIFVALFNKVIKPLCWGNVSSREVTSMLSSYMSKDPYNPALGNEDLNGIITRFFTNLKIYSSQLFEMLGLKGPHFEQPNSHLYSVMLIALMLLGAFWAFRRRQYAVLFVSVFVACMLGATFIVMHAFWAQGRMILVYLPLILMVVFYGVVMLLKVKQLRWLQWLYFVMVGLLLIVNLNRTADKVNKNLPALRKNIAGNIYYGWTPDWVNYFKMSAWVAKNLPEDVVVACRKAPMSFIYSKGRTFSGISGVPTISVDSLRNVSGYQHHFLGIVPDGMSVALFDDIRPEMKLLVLGDNKLYFIYDLAEPKYKAVMDWFTRNKQTYFTVPDSMIAAVRKAHKQSYAVSPDALLNGLRDRRVEYVIDASLRMNPAQKTGDIITTVSRYLYFIEHKYPGILEQIQQIGGQDDEPAVLYKIHYPKGMELAPVAKP